jgi:hypothetical protein
MDAVFGYKLLWSFVVGSIWITLSTVAAERYGSKLGGLIGGLPSTVAVTLLFIGLTQSPEAASRASTVIPLAQGLNGVFIIVFLLVIGRGLPAGLTSALLAWGCIATALIKIDLQTFWISVVGWLFLAAASTYVVEKRMTVRAHGKVRVRYTPLQIAFRALFSGAVISFAVLMGKLGGPVYGGVFAAFPAVFTSTLTISYFTGGAEFSRAVAKSLMVSSLINVVLYAIAVRYLYLWIGLAAGTMLALAFSGATGYLTYIFMRSKIS